MPYASVSRPSVGCFFLALSSAVLLVLSFPNFNQPWCAWVALVPWLALVRACSSRKAWWWSYGIGAVFFLASMWWLVHVTVIGWLLLCAYLACYFGVFGWIAHRIVHSPQSTVHSPSVTVDGRRWTVDVSKLMVIPAAWVALEYARSHLLSGFGWNLLGYSQTPWLALIQHADLTGVWGVSFVIVLVNVGLAQLLDLRRGRGRVRFMLIYGMVTGGALLALLGYGRWRLSQVTGASTVRVAVVQGNVPQARKWDEAFQEEILAQYEALTEAAAATRPELIIWPETAVPGFLGLDEMLTRRVLGLAQRLQRPLLVGTPTRRLAAGRFAALNSAALIDETGRPAGRYDKLRLVPFGEFIPFERWAPWLRAALPPIGDFIAGQDYTVFHIGSGERSEVRGEREKSHTSHLTPYTSKMLAFSVLICFEDIFPELARRFVRDGARMLLVITNDAWFGPTAAAYQHAQASTFRAIESRVPVVRAANTGWSGCIDPAGRWVGRVQDARGAELFVAGAHTCDVPLGAADSLFLRWGDWFAFLCVGGCFGWVIFAIIMTTGRSRNPSPFP
ncbi:MAG: apolipoprotein N-acyltransferase [Candidatus Omnitrophota bacterium]|nr:apolipoprotein N-acyltransferase [Candidatus Omnitrophota bacterium]